MDKRHYAPAIAAVASTDESFPRPTFHGLRAYGGKSRDQCRSEREGCPTNRGPRIRMMTLDTYAGLFDDDLHDSASRINEALNANRWA